MRMDFEQDLISDLPQSIIETILIKLPIRDAVRTSILSSRWRYKWATITQLAFDDKCVLLCNDRAIVENDLANFITRCLFLHDGPIHKFSLSTSYLQSSYDIDQWLLFLSRKDIKELVLDLGEGEWFRAPSSLFSCKNLTHLELVSCELDSPPCFKGFFRLKYLNLRPTQAPDLSFMHIYGQRVLVPGAIIIDGGSGYCKYGWSKYSSPSGRSATFLEFGNIESPMSSRLRHFFSTICSRMQVKTFTQPIIMSIPLCHYDDTESAKGSRRQLKEAIYSALFDMNVPAVCAINQATLALFAARHTSGIVVNIGFHQTSIVPILHGKIMHKVGVEVIGIGALKITGFLKEQMQQNNVNFQSLYTVRTLKENLCYVALDYEAELSKDTQASFQVPSEGWITLSKERFQTGEILFQPRIAGMQAMALQQAVALCMDHCQDTELTGDNNWYKTVVLAGGSACLPGLPERLEKELRGYLPASMSSGIRVIPPPYGVDSAWFGAKLVSNLSTFTGSWCMTKRQFRHWSRRKPMW